MEVVLRCGIELNWIALLFVLTNSWNVQDRSSSTALRAFGSRRGKTDWPPHCPLYAANPTSITCTFLEVKRSLDHAAFVWARRQWIGTKSWDPVCILSHMVHKLEQFNCWKCQGGWSGHPRIEELWNIFWIGEWQNVDTTRRTSMWRIPGKCSRWCRRWWVLEFAHWSDSLLPTVRRFSHFLAFHQQMYKARQGKAKKT